MRQLENLEEAKKAMIEKINKSKHGDDIILIVDEFFCSAGDPMDLVARLNAKSVVLFSEIHKTSLDEANYRLIKIMITHYLESTKQDPVVFFKRLMG